MNKYNDIYEIDEHIAELLREKDREIERLSKELKEEKDKNFILNNKLLQLERKPENNHLSYHTSNKVSNKAYHPIQSKKPEPITKQKQQSNIIKPVNSKLKPLHKGHSMGMVKKGKKIQTESM